MQIIQEDKYVFYCTELYNIHGSDEWLNFHAVLQMSTGKNIILRDL